MYGMWVFQKIESLFMNVILVCNVPIVKKNIVKINRPELIPYNIIGLGLCF